MSASPHPPAPPVSQQRSLYGGTITCEIPAVWKDVSDLRPVPDHQEVYLDESSAAANSDSPGRTLIFEILSRQGSVSDDQAAHFFFQDLAQVNEATSEQDVVFRSTPPPVMPQQATTLAAAPNVVVRTGIGMQKIAHGRSHDVAGNPRRQVFKWVKVELCVLRLEQVDTEVLITLSSPTDDDTASRPAPPTEYSDAFRRAVETFRVVDWSLFGPAAAADMDWTAYAQ